MIISIIAAIGQNRELGKDNKLLWHIPEDLKRFKKLTTNHAVIMGRKTYESIGKPLSNRTNIIVTRDIKYHALNCIIVHSLKEACAVAEQKEEAETFIIGGGEIYKQAIGLADKLYLTLVDARLPSLRPPGTPSAKPWRTGSGVSGQADTFFPDYSAFAKIISEETHSDKHYAYTFLELTR